VAVMKRGDIFRIYRPKQDDPRRYRFYVVVSRQDLIDSNFSTVVCAPVSTRGHGLSTQVPVGMDEGLKHDGWIGCDNLRSIAKSQLTEFVGSLSKAKTDDLNMALAIALDLD
jgi:mRNA interferase MazF